MTTLFTTRYPCILPPQRFEPCRRPLVLSLVLIHPREPLWCCCILYMVAVPMTWPLFETVDLVSYHALTERHGVFAIGCCMVSRRPAAGDVGLQICHLRQRRPDQIPETGDFGSLCLILRAGNGHGRCNIRGGMDSQDVPLLALLSVRCLPTSLEVALLAFRQGNTCSKGVPVPM